VGRCFECRGRKKGRGKKNPRLPLPRPKEKKKKKGKNPASRSSQAASASRSEPRKKRKKVPALHLLRYFLKGGKLGKSAAAPAFSARATRRKGRKKEMIIISTVSSPGRESHTAKEGKGKIVERDHAEEEKKGRG